MRKVLAVVVALVASVGVTTATAGVANAYQVPGSSWTWHWYDNISPTQGGAGGMQNVFEDNYDLSNTCAHLWVSGDSWIDRQGPGYDGSTVDSATLIDDWTFDTTVGSASISFGGPGVSTGAQSMNWTTTYGGEVVSHNYPPFEVFADFGGNFWQIYHYSHGYATIAGANYAMGSVRQETVC